MWCFFGLLVFGGNAGHYIKSTDHPSISIHPPTHFPPFFLPLQIQTKSPVPTRQVFLDELKELPAKTAPELEAMFNQVCPFVAFSLHFPSSSYSMYFCVCICIFVFVSVLTD
jgi:hypothetical protein